jgi:hypothetical protein
MVGWWRVVASPYRGFWLGLRPPREQPPCNLQVHEVQRRATLRSPRRPVRAAPEPPSCPPRRPAPSPPLSPPLPLLTTYHASGRTHTVCPVLWLKKYTLPVLFEVFCSHHFGRGFSPAATGGSGGAAAGAAEVVVAADILDLGFSHRVSPLVAFWVGRGNGGEGGTARERKGGGGGVGRQGGARRRGLRTHKVVHTTKRLGRFLRPPRG